MIEQSTLEETQEIRLQFEKRGGLLPVVVQDQPSGTILMQGYTNELAFQTTLEKRLATFWSTSRHALWTKGETSGDYLKIKAIFVGLRPRRAHLPSRSHGPRRMPHPRSKR